MPLRIDAWDDDDGLIAGAAASRETKIRVVRPAGVSVVLGSGSKPEKELAIDACRADGVRVARRRAGGCSVVLDAGNLVVSIARPVDGLGGIQSHFRLFTAWICDALSSLGLPGCTRDGVSDLARDGRKVGGSGVFRKKGLLYYSTTLLVEPRIDLIERYLLHPPREPEYRNGRPHREFLATLGGAPRFWRARALNARLAAELTPERLESFAASRDS